MQDSGPTGQNWWLRLLIAGIVLAVLAPSPVPQPMVNALRSASIALSSSQPGAALAALEEVIQFNPDFQGAYYWAAESAFRSGAPKRALSMLERWEELSPDDPKPVCWRGHALAEAGQSEKALRAWEDALESCHQKDLILERMASTYEQLGRYEDAIRALEKLAASTPRDQELRLRLGLLLVSVNPERAYEHLAFAAREQSSPDQMLSDLLEAIQTDGGEAGSAYRLIKSGRILLQNERWKLAARALSQALVLEPKNGQALSLLGVALLNGGQDPTSVLDAAERASPDAPLNYILRSMQHLREGDPGAAITALEIASELDPENPAVWAQLGSAHAMNNDRELALENYLHAAEIAQDRADFWLLLAGFCNSNQYELRSIGLPAARNALALQTDNPSAMDALGYGHYLLEDLIMAERLLHRALDADPMDPRTQYHFALLNISKQEFETARSALRMTLQLAADDPVARLAEQALDRLAP